MNYLKIVICILLCSLLLTACAKAEVSQPRTGSVASSESDTAITVTSAANVSLVWSPENQEVSQQFTTLLLTKDEELDRDTSLDIAPNNLNVSIIQGEEQTNYFLWLWFGEESRAIVQNQEMVQDGTDEFGNLTGYHSTWYISVEKSNELREMLKELAPPSSTSLNSTLTDNISRQEENSEQIPESQVPSQESLPLHEPEEITLEEYTKFQQYLEQNLSGDDYAYIDMGTSGKPPCIWVVNSEKLEAVVAAYTGEKLSFQKIDVEYSLNEIKQAIAEVETLPLVTDSYRKISSISCYEGFLDVLLLEPYEEFETYLASKYGAMVRVSVVGTNPTE